MDAEVVVALIQIVPAVSWVLVAAVVIALFYRPIRYHLLPRLGAIDLFGVEATFVRERMDRAIVERSAHVSDDERARVLRRVSRMASVFHGASLLWVGAAPRDTIDERAMLRFAGVSIELAASEEDALALFERGGHEVMIVRLRRGEGAALELALEASRRAPGRPIILYAGTASPADGLPPGVFALTDRPDELLHYVADALERARC